MKILFLVILSILSNDPRDIAKANQLKRMAEKAYTDQNFKEAALHYSMLLDTMKHEDTRALLNMGHAFFKAGDTTYAAQAYQKLAMSSDQKLQSLAYQQLGVINQKPSELPKALNYFKQAIKADPTNQEARYNYELVKKKLQQQKDQNKDDQNKDDKNDQKDQDKKDQQNKDQKDQKDQDQNQNDKKEDQQDQNQDQKDQKKDEKGDPKQENKDQKDGEKKENEQDKPQEQSDPKQEGEDKKEAPQPSTKEKLQQMNLNEETARMLLEAMRNSEVQYLQQMKKKPSKAPDSKKPDW